jgi:hypothetical protein
MAVNQIGKVTLPISEDSTYDVRTAIRGAEDELNRMVVDINKALVQLEGLVMTRTRLPEP